MSTLPTARAGDHDLQASGPEAAALAELRTSARGWHGAQLAVLGFIGLCGVLQGDGGDSKPGWLQDLAGLLVLLALALACTATALVASAAWPVYGGKPSSPGTAAELQRSGRRLRSGLVLTFVAVTVLAVATSSAWWPAQESTAGGSAAGAVGSSTALVEVTTDGGTACGTLAPADPGTLVVVVGGQRFVLALTDVRSVRPADAC